MTIREAIAATIDPYSLSDEAVDKAAIDAFYRFGGETALDTEASYLPSMKKQCGFAAMLLLRQLLPLSSENIGGVSQSYRDDILDTLKGIAKDIGVSPDLVLDSDGDNVVTYCSVW